MDTNFQEMLHQAELEEQEWRESEEFCAKLNLYLQRIGEARAVVVVLKDGTEAIEWE